MRIGRDISMNDKKKLIVGITGASGVILGIELLKEMRLFEEWETELIISSSAKTTIALETTYDFEEIKSFATRFYENNEMGSNVASGTYKTDAMIIVPCSMKTVAGIATGYSDNLLLRAADVTIKEKRQLIIVPRETPLNAIHLRNLLTLAELGIQIIPPLVAYYHQPKTIDDHNQQIIGRILDNLQLNHPAYKRWEK